MKIPAKQAGHNHMGNRTAAAALALAVAIGIFGANRLQAPAEPITAMTEPSAEQTTEDRSRKIDEYFEARKMPLAGYGKKFVEAADRYKLDWRLLPAISIIESSGGLHVCDHNPFGWGSCRTAGFRSFDEAIEIVAKNISGNDPKTEQYYKGKGTLQVLRTYNPPSVSPGYADKVMGIMAQIAK